MIRVVPLSILLIIALCCTSAAQNNRYALEISPLGTASNPVIVQTGTTLNFTARLFEFTPAGKIEVPNIAVHWSVDPASFGTISSTGQLLPGPVNSTTASAHVIATVATAGMTLQASSRVAHSNSNTGHYTFTGVVTTAANLPIHNARVSVMSRSATPFLLTGLTNSNGRYAIQVPAGSYSVYAEASGYIAEYFDNVATINLATVFTTDPAKPTYDNIDFVLGTGGSISGTVTDASSGHPLPGIHVAIEIASNTRPPTSSAWTVQTGNDGKYTISGLADGQYTVFAQGKDFITEWFNDQKDRNNANPVLIAGASQVTGIDFALDQRPPDPVYSISGQVLDASSQPIAHATVMASGNPSSNRPIITAVTDQNGEYTLTVHEGSWIVWATAQGFVPEWFDNAAGPGAATPVVLTFSSPVRSGVDFSLGTGGAIEGYVVNGATNTPLAGATVAVLSGPNSSTPAGGISSHAVTDQNGFYRISGLAAGDHYVMAQAQGFTPQYFDMAATLTLATKVAVVDGQTTTGIDFALSRMPGISGMVTNEATSQPIVGAHVILDGVNTRAVAITDVNGNYHLTAAPGTYKVRAYAPGYAEEWYNEKADYQSADDVLVPQNGDVTGIDFTLTRHGGSIAGIVLDENSNPVPGAQVTVWINTSAPSNSTVTGYGKATTDAHGAYSIDALPAGNYLVRAQAAGFIPEFYDNATSPQTATLVQLTANQAATGIDFELTAGGGISGTITDASTAAPIAHAYVHVRGALRGVEFGTRTDAQGQYRIEGLPSGNYTVFFAASRYIGEYYDDTRDPAQATLVTVTAPAIVTGINAALTPGNNGPRKYNGSVTTDNPAMSCFVLVEAINPDNGLSIMTTTDLRGGFSLDAWDNAIIRARAIGHVGAYAGNTYNWKESTTNGFTGEINFQLSAITESGLAELTGTVRDASTNSPLAGAWVYAFDASGAPYFAVTGPDGSYSIPNTANGDLNVMVSEVRYEPTHETGGVSDAHGNADISARRTGLTSVDRKPAAPSAYALKQNYPNPFNPSTAIAFTLPKQTRAMLRVFNLLGQEIAVIANGTFNAGTHAVTWNADGVPSGIYLYRLEADGKVLTRRMMLTK
ncbi:MAG: carboxypeptidase regulatory-like domain-containing protein [Bacteroidia bacterium]|nr:carboxypeptidase regulatory-like domain-containing protein [Bacteroidia bacterium]